MQYIIPTEMRTQIEHVCGPINWHLLERDLVSGTPDNARFAMYMAQAYLRERPKATFQEIYEWSGLADIDLYIGIGLLVQRKIVTGRHPYSGVDWSHDEVYVYDPPCAMCGERLSQCHIGPCPHGLPA